jgi:hypothetical protein
VGFLLSFGVSLRDRRIEKPFDPALLLAGESGEPEDRAAGMDRRAAVAERAGTEMSSARPVTGRGESLAESAALVTRSGESLTERTAPIADRRDL